MTGEEAIKIVRALDATQAEVAALIGVSPVALQKWAHGGGVSGPAAVLLSVLRSRLDFLATLRELRGD